MCMKPQVAKVKPAFRKSLRNAAINYRNGWFFVTSQVAHNKSIFGAIVGERYELNAAGPGVAPAAPIQAATGVGAAVVSARAASAAETPALISTFTSAQEREALRRALAKGRPVIQAIPQGIPSEGEISPELRAALCEGRALLISPQPMGSRLNKKVATWCNEYVLRHADEIWVGDLSPNGMLSSMLHSMKRL